MGPLDMTSTNVDDLARIAAADHPDPHSVLGPHADAEGIVIRAFRPDALEIHLVLEDGTRAPMQRVHGLGVFEARLTRGFEGLSYRYEVRYARGTFTVRDPYAFAPSLGDLDLHLAAEGTHQR